MTQRQRNNSVSLYFLDGCLFTSPSRHISALKRIDGAAHKERCSGASRNCVSSVRKTREREQKRKGEGGSTSRVLKKNRGVPFRSLSLIDPDTGWLAALCYGGTIRAPSPIDPESQPPPYSGSALHFRAVAALLPVIANSIRTIICC